jgi:hypothetical protein
MPHTHSPIVLYRYPYVRFYLSPSCLQLYGPVEGCRNDSFLVGASRLEEMIHNEWFFFGRDGKKVRYCAYADKGYRRGSHEILRPFADAEGNEATCNKIMSGVRITVEHAFGKVKDLFKTLRLQCMKRPLQCRVGMWFCVAAFLANCHTCLRGSQGMKMYECKAPALEEYIKPLDKEFVMYIEKYRAYANNWYTDIVPDLLQLFDEKEEGEMKDETA